MYGLFQTGCMRNESLGADPVTLQCRNNVLEIFESRISTRIEGDLLSMEQRIRKRDIRCYKAYEYYPSSLGSEVEGLHHLFGIPCGIHHEGGVFPPCQF